MSLEIRSKFRPTIGFIVLIPFCLALAACGGGGSEEGRGEERFGHEGPGGDEGGDGGVAFESDGASHGVFESVPLAPDESFAGLLGDTEVAVRFDAAERTFTGRLRNEAEAAVCDVSAAVVLDGAVRVDRTPSGDAFLLDGLTRYGCAEFEFPVAEGASFDEWVVAVETTGCSNAPAGTGGGEESGEGNEGSGEHGEGECEGDEGGEEGSEEGGEESGDEASPPIPLTEAYSGMIGNQTFFFAYDASTGAFRGTVENTSESVVCESRTEMHLGVGTDVIELGPTIPVDLTPGDVARIVMSAGGYALDTYTLHPESSPCP